MDERCRVTVVGERRQVDLAVPADAPITTYVDTLARLCDQETNDIMPPAWSLATVTAGPFAPERSLTELGIVDGETLYLRDVIANEYADPVVQDVGERVTEIAETVFDRRWDGLARTVGIMLFGLGWLVAALVVLAARHQVGAGALADLAATAGLTLPAIAWVAAERRWPVPAGLRTALALSAVPLLALATRTMAVTSWSDVAHGPHATLRPAGLTIVAILGGALVGAFLAAVAAPGPASLSALLVALVAAVAGGLLAVLRADVVTDATLVAVLGFALLTLVPVLVGRLVGFSYRHVPPRGPMKPGGGDPVEHAVRAAAVLLVVWNGGLSAVTATALVPMAASRSGSAAAVVGILGCALLLRSAGATLVTEGVAVGLAAAIGLFTLLLVGPGHAGGAAWLAPTLLCGVAVVLLAYAFRRLMRSPDRPSMARPRWLTGLGAVLGGLSVAPALATFGLFDQFVELGHHL